MASGSTIIKKPYIYMTGWTSLPLTVDLTSYDIIGIALVMSNQLASTFYYPNSLFYSYTRYLFGYADTYRVIVNRSGNYFTMAENGKSASIRFIGIRF